ncbi:MAG: hypothetical protein JO362_01280 [Streptomycetaceae bacterium]|nr:hypothetical protein [Streptomycetaceae bacterium]
MDISGRQEHVTGGGVDRITQAVLMLTGDGRAPIEVGPQISVLCAPLDVGDRPLRIVSGVGRRARADHTGTGRGVFPEVVSTAGVRGVLGIGSEFGVGLLDRFGRLREAMPVS